ncbi:MAG: FAD-dependent oxidoreductase [Acidobacteriia bacterium]|nr:FAD-dependent oxidoreductase [Terriglobia bacterium]
MDVAVVGAGAFGAWTALLLSRAGHKVTLIDRFGPANEHSSSAGESRIIRSAYGPDEIYTSMARRSLQLWKSFFLEERCPECFQNTGVLWMAPKEEPTIWQAKAVFERLLIPCEWMAGEKIAAHYPQFQLQGETVALLEPDAGVLLAEKSVRAVVGAALRAGARYERTNIKRPVSNSYRLSWIEAIDGRRFTADQFVFACGSWLPKLFEILRETIRPTRQDLFFFGVPGDRAQQFRPGVFPVWIDQTEPRIGYGFPDLGNGLKLGFHHLGPPFDVDASRHTATPDQIGASAEYLARRLPGLRGSHLKATQVCHYENTPNGDFLVDVHPEANNVWLVGGGSGHGFKHAPTVGAYTVAALEGSGTRQPRFSLAANRAGIGRRVL